MKSRLFWLNAKDFLRGAFIAVLTAIGTVLTIPEPTIKKVGVAALIAAASYLIKNILTNSRDKILKKEI